MPSIGFGFKEQHPLGPNKGPLRRWSNNELKAPLSKWIGYECSCLLKARSHLVSPLC